MATSRDSSSMEDVTLCSICFEKFKTPRVLPCAHSFCHSCLSSYIGSVCQSTEPRLGFNCPLCREYIPSFGALDKPDEWASLYPVSEVLQVIACKPDEKSCDACLRENVNENATGFCSSCAKFLCKMCTIYHKRNLLTHHHAVCQMNAMKSGSLFPELGNNHRCSEHKNKRIKFFCNDHQQACCSLCVVKKHRKCESVDTIEDMAKRIKENGELEVLLGDVKNLERKLTEVKTEQEKSITEMENAADEIIEKTEKEFKELVFHLEMLKNKHLEEVTGALKKGREKLSDSTVVLTDGIQCANYCCRNIERVREMENNAEMVMSYCRVKEKIMQLKGYKFMKKEIEISETKSQVWKEVRNMVSFGNIEYSEFDHHAIYDVNEIILSMVCEFSIAGGNSNVCAGNFLSNGCFVAANFKANEKCYIYIAKTGNL